MPIRTLIVDDHSIVREGLRNLLEQHDDIRVVGEAENGHDAVALAARHLPDVIVMDIAMPEMNGLEATRQILEAQPATHIICLSMHEDRRFVIRLLRAGAHGYLLKEAAVEDLIDAIHAVVSGRLYVSSRLTPYLVDAIQGAAAKSEKTDGLTPREREVLQLIAEGHTSNYSSNHLDLSLRRIDTHRRNIIEKLNAHSIAELTRIAIREGMILP